MNHFVSEVHHVWGGCLLELYARVVRSDDPDRLPHFPGQTQGVFGAPALALPEGNDQVVFLDDGSEMYQKIAGSEGLTS